MTPWLHRASLIVLATVTLFACGDDMGRVADGGAACDTEGCDDPEPDMFACQNVLDGRGRPMDAAFLDGLGDPFANVVLKRPGACPRTYSETIAKLRLEDDDRCADDLRTGMLGRIVSERAQLLQKPDVVRAVVGRQCGRRLPYEMLFAVPPIDADDPKLPQTGLQVMSLDRAAGVFNFYALEGEGEGAEWVFHGNSFDQVDPQTRTTSACASCHSDGGLVMREIDAPWVHWESASVRTVGAGIAMDRFSELGARSTGAELSGVVRAGNEVWNRTRIGAFADPLRTDLHGGSTRALLEPLFCGSSFNLQSAGEPNEVGSPLPVREIPSSFFVDPLQQVTTAVPLSADAYTTARDEAGSRIEGTVGHRDTFFGFTYVERSASDLAYVQTLLELGIVDDEFVSDVLSVDFTEPVYSASRCALLELAPSFDDLDNTQAPPGDTPDAAGCCVAHAGSGCEDAEVEACVCEEDDYCCAGSWDQGCVNAVIDRDCGSCSAIAPVRGVAAQPGTSAAAPDADRLRNALHASLEGAEGLPAAQLRSALATPGEAAAHRDRAARFVQACADRASKRDPEGFVRDLLDVAAWRRREAMGASALLDTPGVVATDDLDPPMDLRLDPTTCTRVGG
ncbi:MAG: hypothetical protein ACRBN8_32445 [Nannocystales bacterium]